MSRPRSHSSIPLMLAMLAAAGCGGAKAGSAPVPEAAPHSLSGLARVPVAVLPTYEVRVEPTLPWSDAVSAANVRRLLDADIADALAGQGLVKTWVFPAALEASYRRNSTYGADPYALDEEPLRAPSLQVDARLPEPLASQVRTLVALHDDVRLVLAPLELRLEPAAAGGGRGVLRLVLLDARMSNVRWIGDITGDPAPTFGPVITASVAAKLAAAVAAP